LIWAWLIKFVEVDERGIITIPALEAVLSEKTVLVTFAYANSEVGTVQPVLRLVRRIRKFEEVNGKGNKSTS
jgi:cysteine desulfurase